MFNITLAWLAWSLFPQAVYKQRCCNQSLVTPTELFVPPSSLSPGLCTLLGVTSIYLHSSKWQAGRALPTLETAADCYCYPILPLYCFRLGIHFCDPCTAEDDSNWFVLLMWCQISYLGIQYFLKTEDVTHAPAATDLQPDQIQMLSIR